MYWLLGEGSTRHAGAASAPGYYRNVYGTNPERMALEASALAALFENIELAPVDHALPDLHTYSSGKEYKHPDLRITRSYELNEWAEDADQLTKYLLQAKPELANFLHQAGITDPFAQEHFVARLILQARIAVRRDAVLVGDELFERASRLIMPSMGAFIEGWPEDPEPPETLTIPSRLLNVTGLYIPSLNFDAFCDIRASSEISEYANGFRTAIGEANDGGDLESN